MLSHVAEIAPLRRNVTLEDVVMPPLSCARTWRRHHREILYVDSGFSTVGMSFPQERGLTGRILRRRLLEGLGFLRTSAVRRTSST